MSSFLSSPQPRQVGAPSPGAPPTILPSSSSLCVSSYSNTHVSLPSPQPSSNFPNYSIQCPSSASVAYSAQSQFSVGHEQYSHRSVPSGSSIDMRYGNVPPDPGDVICLDSDNDVDSWNQLMNPSSTSNTGGSGISQATLLPGPKILTVPFPSATNPTPSSLSSTPFTSSHTPSASPGGPPFNAAVAHLMAFLKEREGPRENTTSSSFAPSSVPQNQHTHFSASTTPLSTSQSTLSQSLFTSGNQPLYNPPIPGGNQHSMGVSQQASLGSHQLQTLTSCTNTPVGLHMPSSGHHNTGQYTSNSLLGQTEFPDLSVTHTGVGGQFGLPTNLTSVTTSHQAHSSHLSSLLQSTNETISSPQPEQPAHSYGSTSSVPSHSVGYDIDPTITALLSSTLPSETSMTGFPLSNTTSSALSTSTSLPPPAQEAVSQSHASHVTHEVSSSPPRPLFSPPKLPLSREGVPVAPSQSSLSHSMRVSGHPPSNPLSANSVSQGSISSPSPPPPVTSPHPPPSSLPRSPSTVSPISQPPTPSTSIPLLSPVAAHFFHVSMNKSPKPSLSPGHTPTPSPSPSSHHHPVSSPHMRSPPSVSTATSQTVKNGPTTSASSHSGFHGNSTALNHDAVSGSHGNIPGSYGNSCVIK